jgi:hypothetical protein
MGQHKAIYLINSMLFIKKKEIPVLPLWKATIVNYNISRSGFFLWVFHVALIINLSKPVRSFPSFLGTISLSSELRILYSLKTIQSDLMDFFFKRRKLFSSLPNC